jgi:hypothetical protein
MVAKLSTKAVYLSYHCLTTPGIIVNKKAFLTNVNQHYPSNLIKQLRRHLQTIGVVDLEDVISRGDYRTASC